MWIYTVTVAENMLHPFRPFNMSFSPDCLVAGENVHKSAELL